MSARTLMITGASGQLGRAVVARLADSPDHVVAGTRDPAKLTDLPQGIEARRVDFDDDVDALTKAFTGVDRLLIVSTDAVDQPGKRASQHRRAIDAAVAAGVKHLLYTSFCNAVEGSKAAVAPDHVATEKALAASGIPYTSLQNNLYMDLLLGSIPAAIERGQLAAASGDGAISYVTRADCAAAAAGALSDTCETTRQLAITGPDAITGAQLASIASELSGKPVQYVPLTADQLTAAMVEGGMPAPFAQLLVSFDEAAAAGELDAVTDQVEKLSGTPATSVSDFLGKALSA